MRLFLALIFAKVLATAIHPQAQPTGDIGSSQTESFGLSAFEPSGVIECQKALLFSCLIFGEVYAGFISFPNVKSELHLSD